MKRWVPFLGIVGLVLLGFGTGGFFIARGAARALMWGHGILGGLLVVFSIFAGKKGIHTRLGELLRGGRFVYALRATVLLAGLALLLTSLFVQLQRVSLRWDTTAQDAFSLSESLRGLLRDLEEPLEVHLVELPGKVEVSTLLDFKRQVTDANPELIDVRIIDPVANPRVVDSLRLQSGDILSLALGTGDSVREVRANQISEEVLFNELRGLLRKEVPKVYYIEGHGEPDLHAAGPEGLLRLKDGMAQRGVALTSLLLPGRRALPSDAAGVLLAAPQHTLSAEEESLLHDYVHEGGNLLLLHDPLASATIPRLAARWGITLAPAVLLQEEGRGIEGATLSWQIPSRTLGAHASLRGISPSTSAMFLYASPVLIERKDTAETRTFPLALTAENTWAEFDVAALSGDTPSAEFDATLDTRGPLNLGVLQEFTPYGVGSEKPPHRLMVWGDIEWVRNVNIDLLGNRALIERSLEWVVASEQWIPLPPRRLRFSMFPVSDSLYYLLLTLAVILPEFVLLGGLLLWWVRRIAAESQSASRDIHLFAERAL